MIIQYQQFATINIIMISLSCFYLGGRFANEMVWWCEKFRAIENYAEPLKTDHDVKQAIGNSEVIVIGFFKDIESQPAKDYLKAARDYEEYRVSITTDQDAMKRLEVRI